MSRRRRSMQCILLDNVMTDIFIGANGALNHILIEYSIFTLILRILIQYTAFFITTGQFSVDLHRCPEFTYYRYAEDIVVWGKKLKIFYERIKSHLFLSTKICEKKRIKKTYTHCIINSNSSHLQLLTLNMISKHTNLHILVHIQRGTSPNALSRIHAHIIMHLF